VSNETSKNSIWKAGKIISILTSPIGTGKTRKVKETLILKTALQRQPQ